MPEPVQTNNVYSNETEDVKDDVLVTFSVLKYRLCKFPDNMLHTGGLWFAVA